MLEEGSGSGLSSGASSPEPMEPFTPVYSVRFTDRVTKDGESVKFTIQVSQNSLTVQMIEREFEDFEYLEHCIVTGQNSNGLIIPPLPQRSAIDPHTAEIQSRKQMGKGSKTLIADDFHKDCRQLQKYLELVLSHPVLGKNQRLHEFLTIKEAPPRTKVKKGLMTRIADSFDMRKSSYPDTEEFFQKERDWVAKYGPASVEASEAFNKIVYAQMRISHCMEEMVTALKLSSSPDNTLHHKQFNIINYLFLDSLEALKNQIDDKANKDDSGLGSEIHLCQRFIYSENTMLLHRTSLMVDYQASNRALDKAKPNRKEAAEATKHEAEKAFEECSDVARIEIKRFHRERVFAIQSAIEEFGRQQLISARATLQTLSNTLSQIKAINL
ncbi:unnamed protein product [Meganyctiphanes norvegica]|uniref:PX domain-containing protein n=1 Tax=Meganyctiphanes norvegica TaxID=48144 RepID=A0AAV2R428_MEGNR